MCLQKKSKFLFFLHTNSALQRDTFGRLRCSNISSLVFVLSLHIFSPFIFSPSFVWSAGSSLCTFHYPSGFFSLAVCSFSRCFFSVSFSSFLTSVRRSAVAWRLVAGFLWLCLTFTVVGCLVRLAAVRRLEFVVWISSFGFRFGFRFGFLFLTLARCRFHFRSVSLSTSFLALHSWLLELRIANNK